MKRFLTITLLAIVTMMAAAQTSKEERHLYTQAENDYSIGRLNEARDLLKEHIDDFHGDYLLSAYRLLVLCNLALDEDDEAQQYANLLLTENPYYSTMSEDPPRFVEMVNRFKSGRNNTITTASSQAESLDESPVPVMLITEDMIRISGARNLKEVLVAYVPGMTGVDSNDDINIAMRGIYSQGQENILIMLNGHRLNSYSTNVASPDFSISLEKVKQIEVLRGPASSLYGGVALSAVVNVITKHGVDVDGVLLKAGGGSYGQLRGDLLLGKRFFDLDLMVWGSIYKADGQAFYVPKSETGLQLTQGDVKVGRVGPKPSYDLGIMLNWRNLSFLYNSQFSQIHSPYTGYYTHSPYSYDKYVTYRGYSPGFVTQSYHMELNYRHQWKRLFLSGSVSYDVSDMTHYQVISDSAVTAVSKVWGTPQLFDFILIDGGLYRYQDGQENTLGVQAKGDYEYLGTGRHKGVLSFGLHYSHFKLDDSQYVMGDNFIHSIIDYSWFPTWADTMEGEPTETFEIDNIAKGEEYFADAFLQVKHRWGPLILNGGVRYDYKRRFDKKERNELSPRLALILVGNKWHASLSYSKSFVDAPYLYRKANLLYYKMAIISNSITEIFDAEEDYYDLKPERLYSWQLTLGTSDLLPGLSLELNGYYNRAIDMIYPQKQLHLNAGEGKTYGVEFTSSWHKGPFIGYLSAEWLTFSDVSYMLNPDKIINIEKVPGIPSVVLKSVLGWRFGKCLRLHTHLNYSGEYNGYEMDLSTGENKYSQHTYSARFIMDFGADYTLGRLCFSANVYNLFNTHYTLTAFGNNPVQQQGRWLMGTVAYKF